MRVAIGLLLILCSGSVLFGQAKNNTQPLIIQGRITNCPEKELELRLLDNNGKYYFDTINLDEDGNFYLKTFKVQKPQIASIGKHNIQVQNVFIAPGYNLTITGDGSDGPTLFRTKKIVGAGAESNKYNILLDSILFIRKDTTKWYDTNDGDLLSYLDRSQKLKDSIANIVFEKTSNRDKYLGYFGTLVRLENKLKKLYMLLLHVNSKDYSYEKTVSFVNNNFDKKILNNIYHETYFHSTYYKGLIGGEWLNYLLNLDYKKDSSLRKQKGYNLKKVKDTYKGKVQEYVLFRRIESEIINEVESIEGLNEYKSLFEPYISTFTNNSFKESIASTFTAKEAELIRTQIGKPAPNFTLQSNLGNSHSLKDFKGKVVYLDLWASWCGPCREETPSFKLLYDKYKNDNRIAFIGIAVHNGINEWKKALEIDKPEWLQLFDKDETVWKAYVANWIPKFILIDKQGNIVNFDAPRPSDGKKLEELLKQEMAK